MKNQIVSLIKIIVLAAVLSAGAVYAQQWEWVPPSGPPTGNNAEPSVNVSSAAQVKSGSLGAAAFMAPEFCIGTDCITSWPSGGGGGFWTQSASILYPNNTSWNVGVGTNNPQRRFHVNGTFRLQNLSSNNTFTQFLTRDSATGDVMQRNLPGNGIIDCSPNAIQSINFLTGTFTCTSGGGGIGGGV